MRFLSLKPRAVVLGLLAALLFSTDALALRSAGAVVPRGGVVEFLCGAGKLIGVDTDGYATCRQPASAIVAEDIGLHCDTSVNDTTTLRAALESGGAATGATLRIPSGCRPLLGSPGAGDFVAEMASSTTIECEDKTAGFILARKSCSAGSDTPGAACASDGQCNGGTCVADADAGTSFAPTEGSTYTVFGAASGAIGPAIVNCSIWTNGLSSDPIILGGSGKTWGYCDGAGASTAGEGCVTTCNVASGVLYGVPCTSDGECGAGACVENEGSCKTDGGSCANVAYGVNFAPVGPGKVHPIDFANATRARIENVTVYDHKRGDVTIRSGTSGRVVDSTTTGRSPIVPPVDTWFAYSDLKAAVSTGIVSDPGSIVVRSTGSGWDSGIAAKGGSIIADSKGGAFGGPSDSGWNGTANLTLEGAGTKVYGFTGDGGLYCVLPQVGTSTTTAALNFMVQNAFCDGHVGPKFIIQGAGNQYMGDRGAWAGRGSIIGLGDQRGRCAGSTRSGKVCIFGAGTDATIGCPGSTCDAHDDFRASGAGHFALGAGTLLHTDQTGVTFLRATDSLRCVSGDDVGRPCTVDGDCASSTCRPLRFTDALIDGVNFYSGGGNTAIDLSTSSIGVHSTTLVGGPSIQDWTIDGVLFDSFATGIKFPTNSRFCVGGSNAGTSCDEASDCSAGGGTCEMPVKNFVAAGNMAGVTTPLDGWDWGFGDVSGVKGLLVTDDQGAIVTYTAGEALTKGQLVKLSTTANQVVRVATSDSGEQAAGVALHTALSGAPVKVMRTGSASCISDTGTVAAGDLLERGTTTDGRVQTANSSADVLVAQAMEADGASGSTFRCAVRPPGVQSATASPFQTAALTSDAATQTNDTVVETAFTFTLSANKNYVLDGFLIVTGGATGDMRCNLDGPSGVTVTHAYASSGTDLVVAGDNTDGKCVEIIGGTDNVIAVGGSIINSTNAGALTWKWAQNTSNGTGTTVKAGSWMRLMER